MAGSFAIEIVGQFLEFCALMRFVSLRVCRIETTSPGAPSDCFKGAPLQRVQAEIRHKRCPIFSRGRGT